MARVATFMLGLVMFVGAPACGSNEDTAAPVAEPSSANDTQSSTPSPTPSSDAPAEPTSEVTPEPEPEPEPLPPNFGTQDDIREFFDGEIGGISWKDAPTPRGRTRLLGTVPDTSATIELFGDEKAVDEIAYQVVFDGTNMDINFDRALPMIRTAQEYASEDAAKFVGSELDGFTYLDAVPKQSNTKRFEDIFVRILGIDVINVVNLSMTVGRKPSRP